MYYSHDDERTILIHNGKATNKVLRIVPTAPLRMRLRRAPILVGGGVRNRDTLAPQSPP